MIALEIPDFISSIYNFSVRNGTIISISGKAGTGKTTLGLQLVCNILTRKVPYEGGCIWVQASEAFPKKRLISLFKNAPGELNYLLSNIFVYPVKKPFYNYKEQSNFFTKLESFILPSNVEFIVIDNISHHLRLIASLNSDSRRRAIIFDEFFNSQLFPLIMQCLREKILLILLHEVSFDPALGKSQPFFNKLYSRIQSVNITLSKNLNSKIKKMEIICGDKSLIKKFNYEIRDNGITRL